MIETESKHYKRRQETRKRLINAALSIFGQYGFDAATVDDIAAAAGFSKGAFYFHFPSKEDLFIELLRTYVVEDHVGDHGESISADGLAERRRTLAPLILEFWAHAPRNERIRLGLKGLVEARRDGILNELSPTTERSEQASAMSQAIAAMQDGFLLQEVLGIRLSDDDQRELMKSLVSLVPTQSQTLVGSENSLSIVTPLLKRSA